MARWIFRKIGGKLRKIKIKGQDATPLGLPSFAERKRKIKATIDGELVGDMDVLIPRKKSEKSISVLGVDVVPKFRKLGISTEMMKYVADIGKKTNKKFIRGGELLHPAQAKIRSKIGPTKFIGSGFPPHGEGKRVISKDDAIKFLGRRKKNIKGDPYLIGATTSIKRWRK